MTVNYYGIRGCTYEVYAGRPIIVAPSDADREKLDKENFTYSEGRYIHFLTELEHRVVMSGYPDFDVNFDESFREYEKSVEAEQSQPPPKDIYRWDWVYFCS